MQINGSVSLDNSASSVGDVSRSASSSTRANQQDSSLGGFGGIMERMVSEISNNDSDQVSPTKTSSSAAVDKGDASTRTVSNSSKKDTSSEVQSASTKNLGKKTVKGAAKKVSDDDSSSSDNESADSLTAELDQLKSSIGAKATVATDSSADAKTATSASNVAVVAVNQTLPLPIVQPPVATDTVQKTTPAVGDSLKIAVDAPKTEVLNPDQLGALPKTLQANNADLKQIEDLKDAQASATAANSGAAAAPTVPADKSEDPTPAKLPVEPKAVAENLSANIDSAVAQSQASAAAAKLAAGKKSAVQEISNSESKSEVSVDSASEVKADSLNAAQLAKNVKNQKNAERVDSASDEKITGVNAASGKGNVEKTEELSSLSSKESKKTDTTHTSATGETTNFASFFRDDTQQTAFAHNDKTATSTSTAFGSPNAFSIMDGTPLEQQAHVLKSSSREVSVGVQDPQYGWVEVKTHLNAGQVSASLHVNSVESQYALQQELPAIQHFAATRDLDLSSLTVSTGDQGAGAFQQQAGQGQGETNQSFSPNPVGEGWVRQTSPAISSTSTDGSWMPETASRISVLA